MPIRNLDNHAGAHRTVCSA